MSKLNQRDRERLIKPLGSEHSLVVFADRLEADRPGKSRRKMPSPDQSIVLENRKVCRGQIALVLFVRFFQWHSHRHRADGKMRIAGMWQLARTDKGGVRVIIIDDHTETAGR